MKAMRIRRRDNERNTRATVISELECSQEQRLDEVDDEMFSVVDVTDDDDDDDDDSDDDDGDDDVSDDVKLDVVWIVVVGVVSSVVKLKSGCRDCTDLKPA